MLGSFSFVVVFFLFTVSVMVGLALHTLFQCRILAYIHIFKGPKSLLVFFNILEMLLHCFLGENIFFWSLIVRFIIFLLFLAIFFLCWFGCWFLT